MKWIIEDITLWDPSLTAGEFDSPLEAIKHLVPTFESHWPECWSIRKNANIYKLVVQDADGVYRPVAIVKPKPDYHDDPGNFVMPSEA